MNSQGLGYPNSNGCQRPNHPSVIVVAFAYPKVSVWFCKRTFRAAHQEDHNCLQRDEICVLRNLALARACWTANGYLQSNPSFPSWNLASHCTSVMLVILAKHIANIRAWKGVLILFRLSVALTIWVRRLGLWSILTTGSTLSTNTC